MTTEGTAGQAAGDGPAGERGTPRKLPGGALRFRQLGRGLSDASRRAYTLLAGVLVLGALIGLGFFAIGPIQYVALVPGETCNTLGTCNGENVITIKGAVPPTTGGGELRLVTVGTIDHPNVWTILADWFDSNTAVIPRELEYPPGQTQQQATQQDLDEMQQSYQTAEIAALSYLGTPMYLHVDSVTKGGPADGVLRTDDLITSIDGKAITQLPDPFSGFDEGKTVTVGYERSKVPATTTITIGKGTTGSAKTGLATSVAPQTAFDIALDVNDIGGPSAGLMMALGLIDRLGGVDLTGGKIIAGTGEIADDGTVGVIGGVHQKMVGARSDGATYFLVPAGNCGEASDAPVPGLTLVKVSTLVDAVNALDDIRAGDPAPAC